MTPETSHWVGRPIEDATRQLIAELTGHVNALADLIADLRLTDTDIRIAAESVVTRLRAHDEHPAEALQAADRLLELLWPNAAPEQVGQARWWRTPVGLLCARATAAHDEAHVSHSVAAAILDRAPGTMSALRSRNALQRHPDGGFTRGSVLDRLARQHAL